MHDIHRILAVARGRLEATRFLGVLSRVVAVIGLLVLAVAISDRLPAVPFVPWTWVWPVAGGLALLASAAVWMQRRADQLEVAIAVDDRLHLKERLSTALACVDRDDPFARAAIEDAVSTARDPRTRERVGRTFRVESPRRWWIGPLGVALALMVQALPQADLFADDAVGDDAARDARLVAEESIDAVVEAIESSPELAAALGESLEDLAGASTPDDAVRAPEEIKRDAIKKVTELNRKLDDILNGETGKSAEAIERALAGMKLPEEPGAGRDLAEAMAKGDFASAKQALERMLAELEGGALDAAAREALAAQLEQLADQLEQLADRQEALEQALANAGLDAQLANNPQALEQALRNAEHLNQAQREQLEQLARAQRAAQNACRGLGQACRGLGEAMGAGQAGDFRELAGGMGGQLSDLEQLQMLLQQAQAAQGMCQGQAQGLGQPGNGMGGGMGNRGQGAGGKAPIAPTPTGTKLVQADTPMGEGEIIATMLLEGQPIRGESKATLKRIVAAAAEGYDEATGEAMLPRRYHEAHKHYFGELEAQVERIAVKETAPSGDPGSGSKGPGSPGAGEPGAPKANPPTGSAGSGGE